MQYSTESVRQRD